MPAKTSILIISFNRPADLLELMESLAAQNDLSLLEEILVLNNASTASYAAVEEFAHQHPALKIRYEYSAENLGVSRGRNKLMREAKGNYLLVLDDDIVFTGNNDFAKMAVTLEEPWYREQKTAAVTFRVVYHSNGEQQESAFPHKEYTTRKNEARFMTYYFTGCCHLLQRSVLEKTGVYPTDFFYGMEEYDLSYRIIQQGYSLAYDNRVTVQHKESPLGRQPQYQKLASQWKNKTVVAWRFLPLKYFISTAFAWSFEYIRKIKGHPGTWFKTWVRILGIPFQQKRNKMGRAGMSYLKSVNARLKY